MTNQVNNRNSLNKHKEFFSEQFLLIANDYGWKTVGQADRALMQVKNPAKALYASDVKLRVAQMRKEIRSAKGARFY